jgi:signal transduction histidine kinase
VTNAQRYAHASSVTVGACIDGSLLVLQVEDDGVGGAVERSDLGLQGLRDRVEATGGAFIVDSALGHGTRIEARIPTVVAAA